MTQVKQALARGYCHAANTSKLVDIDLLEAMTKEIIDSFSGEERTMVFDPRETQGKYPPVSKDMLRAAQNEQTCDRTDGPPAYQEPPRQPQPCTAIPQGQNATQSNKPIDQAEAKPLLTFNTEHRDTMITAHQVDHFLRCYMPNSRDQAIEFERDLHMLVRTIYREAQAPLLENMKLMAMAAVTTPPRIMAAEESCVQSARPPGPIVR
jgi:choline dehydrogenase-like flavoprotein